MSEFTNLPKLEDNLREEFLEAGADYVISSLTELKELIRMINSRLVFRKSSE